jgi:hypothetical protein
MSYIFAVKIVGLKKQKKETIAGSLPSATNGKGFFAISSGRQRGHMAGNCASWEADQFGQFAYSGWRQRPYEVCHQRLTARACH